ncbi:MAG: D-alanyl-D-alanine carboxypeptidase family protein [Marinibacterium sp.]
MVIDARTGKVLHARNADARLHPASLTKMMTLYIAFQAVENGEIRLDDKVRVSAHAAAEPPSKLGLRAGQTIALRYLIRAAAVKSANDAATAIGEAISGSEAAFARRMTATAKALGMTRTTFKNANGLTEKGHLSTARDMTTLGRHLLYDYPEYYNLFSRLSTHAGVREVPNTNRRLLSSYKGADGIKTGYTRAAGFNLVASAERGQERIIATVFGGKSSASRNAKVAELLDLGFRKAPSRAPISKPARPVYAGNAIGTPGTAGKTVRTSGVVKKSLRPQVRPVSVRVAEASDMQNQIAKIVASANADVPSGNVAGQSAKSAIPPAGPPPQEIVTRLSTKGDTYWGINIGRYTSRYQAEKVLLRTALSEMATLDGVERRVVKGKAGYDATFRGMTRDMADLACRRLQARNVTCFMMGPG